MFIIPGISSGSLILYYRIGGPKCIYYLSTTKSQHGIWQRLLKVQFVIVVAVILRYVFGLFAIPVIKAFLFKGGKYHDSITDQQVMNIDSEGSNWYSTVATSVLRQPDL